MASRRGIIGGLMQILLPPVRSLGEPLWGKEGKFIPSENIWMNLPLIMFECGGNRAKSEVTDFGACWMLTMDL